MQRVNVSSGAEWEPIIGYSRAVKLGNIVHVSGTTGTKDGVLVGEDDVHAQAVQALENIAHALRAAGATINDVVRTRIYMTNILEWEAVGRAHGRFFGEVRPATTMVEVSRLIGPKMLVEIEAEAILGAASID
jgi:enamine deaminase RidA (YjgF/YER057c/UK114 family)